MVWCPLILTISKYDANKEMLSGFYTSENAGCGSGEIVLLKSNKKINPSETQKVESSSLEDITYLLIDNESVIGKQIVLENVHFQSAKYKITPTSYNYLNELVKILKKND